MNNTESCDAATDESTPLHTNNTARNRASSISSYGSQSLTIKDILATSPSNLSEVTTPISNVTTPNVSNVSTTASTSAGLPTIPSMSSKRGPSHFPPRHRYGYGLYSNNSNNQYDDSDDTGSNNIQPNSSQRQTTSHTIHSLGSRIKISTTLVLLILGLILSACTLVNYILKGPNYNGGGIIRSTDNDVISDEDNGGVEDDVNESIEKHKKIQAKAKDLFDEEGRYIIENYDALPTFSNFLPVSTGSIGSVSFSYVFQYFLLTNESIWFIFVHREWQEFSGSQ